MCTCWSRAAFFVDALVLPQSEGEKKEEEKKEEEEEEEEEEGAGAYEIVVGERAALFSRCGAATERAGEATVGTLLGEALEVGYMVALNLVSTCLERRRRIKAECRGNGR